MRILQKLRGDGRSELKEVVHAHLFQKERSDTGRGCYKADNPIVTCRTLNRGKAETILSGRRHVVRHLQAHTAPA